VWSNRIGRQFHLFADLSWDDVLPSRKSTNSFDIFYNDTVDSWKSKLSQMITTSSTETELISATYCDTKIVFLRKLAQELGFVEVSPTIMFEVNNGAIAIGNSGHFKGSSKHIDLYFFFLSDYISREFFKFERVDTKLHLQSRE
jgi:hypothetical protein